MMVLLGQHGQVQDFEHGINLIYRSAETADENAPQGAYVYGMLKAGELQQVAVPERYAPRDASAAKQNLEKAAYLGFSKAQLRMGSAYELSELGCPFDPAISLHYNALAARQGEAEAEMAISKWFLCGHEGVFEKNEEVAFTYAQRAAVSGLATAQFAMGYFYEVGIWTKPDYALAQDWYRKAAEGGNQDAAGRVDAIKRSKTLSRKDHEAIAVNRIRQTHAPGANSASLDMPDPSRLSLNPNPQASAPYPAGPTNMPQPDFRPASAFGVNPNLRSSSTSPGYPPAGGMPPRPPLQNYSNSYGPGPMNHLSGPGRTPSAPPGAQGYPPGPGPQGRPPRPGTTSPYMQPQDQRPPNHRPPVDLGYVAPIEQRQPRPPHPAEAPRPRPHTGSPAPGPQGPGRPLPQTQQRPSNSGTPKPQQRPGGTPSQAGPAPPQKPMPQQQTPNKVAPSAAKKPGEVKQGKGPSTFDEMGIPNKKDKGDCVSQHCPKSFLVIKLTICRLSCNECWRCFDFASGLVSKFWTILRVFALTRDHDTLLSLVLLLGVTQHIWALLDLGRGFQNGNWDTSEYVKVARSGMSKYMPKASRK
jgi:hypothetical protein